MSGTNASTASVYKWVVDDVMTKMKPEVAQEGLEESVLDELRTLWESKMAARGLLDTDDPRQSQQQHSVQSESRPMIPAPLLQAMLAGNLGAQIAAGALGPQLAAAAGSVFPGLGIKREQPDSGFDSSSQRRHIPQQDGEGDEDDAGDEDNGEAADQDAQPADDEVLSSDSDEDEEDEENQEHYLCCQFEKVNRTKNKWKINMKEGVFHINGKDYLFRKAQGEWIF